MGSYACVRNGFEGKSVDRLPNFSLIMMFVCHGSIGTQIEFS